MCKERSEDRSSCSKFLRKTSLDHYVLSCLSAVRHWLNNLLHDSKHTSQHLGHFTLLKPGRDTEPSFVLLVMIYKLSLFAVLPSCDKHFSSFTLQTVFPYSTTSPGLSCPWNSLLCLCLCPQETQTMELSPNPLLGLSPVNQEWGLRNKSMHWP